MAEYLETMVAVCREVRRVLKPEGTFWLNIGDSYANDGKFGGETGGKQDYLDDANRKRVGRNKRMTGLKPKDLCMIPNRLAIALQDDGWFVRSEIIWAKSNPMPESVTDRPTSSHEKVWLLTKSERYFYDAAAIREAESAPGWDDSSRALGDVNKAAAARVDGPRNRRIPPRHQAYASCDQSGLDDVGRGGGRNARNVWTLATEPYRGAHSAVMATALAERCIKAGCPAGGTVIDPFGGAGTTGLVADRLQRNAVLIEINPDYAAMAERRINESAPLISPAFIVKHTSSSDHAESI